MAYGGYSYLDLKREPGEDEFRVLFWAEGNAPLEKIAEAIASESSVGTWTTLSTMNDYVFTRLRARIYKLAKVRKNAGFIWISYPIEHFEMGNVLQFQASVLGNIFGLKELTSLVACDISFPLEYQQQFSGPKNGLEGIRAYLGTQKERRPHIGTIVKPKVGLTPKEWAKVAYEAYLGGCDFVKDDENLVDQKFCPFETRVQEVLAAMDRIRSETNKKVLYAPNITDRYSKMLERIDFLKSVGAPLAMIDVFIIGYGALLDVVRVLQSKGFLIHAHRAGFAALQRGNFGINYQIHEKFYRLIGVDQLHIGTGVGKMEGDPITVHHYRDIAVERGTEEKLYLGALKSEFANHIKPIMPVASGGVNTGMMEALVALHGRDVNIQAGGGVHGHPGGTVAGAASMRQAVDAIMQNVSLPEYAKKHKELKIALDKFGYMKPNPIIKLLADEKKSIAKLNANALRHGYHQEQ